MAQDKPRAILSFATPNPVGPYKLVTPLNQVQPQQTKTPVLPVMGGALINTTPPPLPTRTSNVPAQDQGQRKLVNVPKPPMADKLKSNPATDYLRVRGVPGEEKNVNAAVGKAHEYIMSLDDNSAIKNRYKMRMYARNTPSFQRLTLDDIMEDLSQFMRPGISQQEAVGILDALGGSINAPGRIRTRPQREEFADSIVQNFKPLKPKEKETFLSLLPEWVGTPDELAKAARSLSK